MTLRMRAVPCTDEMNRPATARNSPRVPLAGSAIIGFETVDALADGQVVDQHPVAALAPDVHDRLTRARAPVCGLTLDRPRIMGILNLTPDSFSDGGALSDPGQAVAQALQMAAHADILDIGGESTRPGAQPVSPHQESARVLPLIHAIRDAGIATPISIDTRNASVARAALDAGADMVNDVSAMTHDPEMLAMVSDAGVPVCLMHAKGDPATMQNDPRYGDVVGEVLDWLEERVAVALAAGIARDHILVDPGIGFGKTLEHNLTLLRRLSVFHDLGQPVLLGASRKRFIGTISGVECAGDRLAGSLAVALHAAAQGAHVIRVHDVAETRQALALWRALAGFPAGELLAPPAVQGQGDKG